MSWMKSTYQAYYGHRDINADAVTTGKYKQQGGVSGRRESTGLGVFYSTRQLLEDTWTTKKLIGVAEIGGSVYNPDGINPDDLKKHLEANGTLSGYQAHR